MTNLNAHVYQLPDGTWLTHMMTDQEAFAFERETFGLDVALENWREIRDWREAGRPPSLSLPDGRKG